MKKDKVFKNEKQLKNQDKRNKRSQKNREFFERKDLEREENLIEKIKRESKQMKVIDIISEHSYRRNTRPTPGCKRVMAIVELHGVRQTRHIDVPKK